MKNTIQLVKFIIVLIFFSSCNEPKQPEPLFGSWLAKYAYVNGNELLGYGNSGLTYSLKPSFFSQDGEFVILIDEQNQKSIVGSFEIFGNEQIDSIKIKSREKDLSNTYKIEYLDKDDKLIMKFISGKNEIYFERIYTNINL